MLRSSGLSYPFYTPLGYAYMHRDNIAIYPVRHKMRMMQLRTSTPFNGGLPPPCVYIIMYDPVCVCVCVAPGSSSPSTTTASRDIRTTERSQEVVAGRSSRTTRRRVD
eukprot:GHVU01052269.1.p2 GENE.GHVU01052269.1~~GHVU01052269.1.p2  ORF type:complete len:108 (+),score=1.31 GHVU01052269.1:448-771(+)